MQFARNFEMDWTEAFTSLRDLPAETRSRLLAGCSIVELAEGTRIFGPGQAPDKFVMLLDGSIRVQQVGGNGREIVLYRVAAGETCALTTACLLGYEDYHAEAVAETDIRAALIRRGLFDQLIADSPEFRRFVFTTFSLRVTSLFRLVEEVVFSASTFGLRNFWRNRVQPTYARRINRWPTNLAAPGKLLVAC